MVVELAGDAPIIGGVGNSTFDLVALRPPAQLLYVELDGHGVVDRARPGPGAARPAGGRARRRRLDPDEPGLAGHRGHQRRDQPGACHLGQRRLGDHRRPAGCRQFGIDLEAVARGCGLCKTATVGDLDEFRSVFAEAHGRHAHAWTIVAESSPATRPYRPSKNCVALRDRFMAALSAELGHGVRAH